MPEDFPRENGTAKERVFAHQIIIIPDELSRKAGEMDQEGGGDEKRQPQPGLFEISRDPVQR